MSSKSFISNSVENTKKIAYDFASSLKIGDVVAFSGNLGVGKTEFIRGICEYFKVNSNISSPTYSIINEYKGKIENQFFVINHLDLYRIKDIEELQSIGYYDYVFNNEGITLIEWSENSFNELPNDIIQVNLAIDEFNSNKRLISINYSQ